MDDVHHQPRPVPAIARGTDPPAGVDEAGRMSWGGCGSVLPGVGESTREAKELCQGSVVRQECLDYAETGGEMDGIWGGLSARGRRKQRSVA